MRAMNRNYAALSLLGVIILASSAVVSAQPQPSPQPSSSAPLRASSTRGEMLYENHCTICHTSVVHVQENHHATSDVAVEGWVRRWATDQKLGWSDQDVLDVTEFLWQRYYKF